MKKGFGKKAKNLLRAACLGVGLTVAAWASDGNAAQVVQQYQFKGTINPTQNLDNVYVFYSLNSSGSNTVFFEKIGHVDAGSNTDFSFLTSDIDPSWYDSGYTVFGTYAADAVTVGMYNSEAQQAIANSWDWSDYFGSSPTETAVAAMLNSDDTSGLTDFYNDNFAWWLSGNSGETITLVNFSTATFGGTAYGQASVVPIPSAILLFAPGLGSVILLRRKNRT